MAQLLVFIALKQACRASLICNISGTLQLPSIRGPGRLNQILAVAPGTFLWDASGLFCELATQNSWQVEHLNIG